MNRDEVETLIGQREGLKLEFKREFDLDGSDKAHKRDEFTKDVLALVNTGCGQANRTAYLIVGAGDRLRPDGTRELFDTGGHNLSTQKLLSIVNARCDPPLSQLEFETVELHGKCIGILTIPPSPHIHHTIRDLVTGPGKVYRRGIVFIRRVEGIDIATPADIKAIRSEKARWNRLQVSHDELRAHLSTVAANPRYVRWDDEGFIDERAKPLPMNVSVFEVETELDRLPTQELAAAVEGREQVVILGDPGSGKTTALERLMLVYARRALQKLDETDLVPVLLALSEYSGEQSLIPLVQASLNEHRVLSLTVTETAALLMNMHWLVLVDGLNELAGDLRDRGLAVLRKLMRTYPRNRYIITCRTREYKSQIGDIDVLVIQALSNKDVLSYLQMHLGSDDGRTLYDGLGTRLRELARNPLMLSMIRDAGVGGSLPQNRAELFQSFTDRLLRGVGKAGERGKRIGLGFKKRILADLAFGMQHERVLTYPLDGLFDIAEPIGARLGYPPSVVLDELLFNGVLRLAGVGRDRCQFMHQAVQEYFAAVSLAEKPQAEMLSIALQEDTFSHELIVLLSGLLPDPSSLVTEIADRAIWLAARCLLEGSELDENSTAATVGHLVTNLHSDNRIARSRSARFLGEIGHPDAVQPLVDALGSDKTTRKRAQEALVNIGEPALEALIDALPSTHGAIHRDIIRILGEIGDRRVIAVLIPDLGADRPTSELAAKIILQFGEQATEQLIAVLDHHNWRIRQQAAWLLGKIGDPRAVDPLIAAFRDDNSNVSDQAARALMRFGEIALASLVSSLNDDDRRIRRGAAKTLAGSPNTAAVRTLFRLSKSADVRLARQASRILDAQSRSPQVAGALIRVLAGADAELSAFVRRALQKLKKQTRGRKATRQLARILRHHAYPDLILPLMDALEHRDSEPRRLAAEALSRPVELTTVGAVLVALDDDNAEVRHAAERLLRILGFTGDHESLVVGLFADDRASREKAASALATAGMPVANLFACLLNSGSANVRRIAKRMLIRMGSAAVEVLQSALGNPDPEVCCCAAFVLGLIRDLSAAESLLSCLDSKCVELRYNAVEALANLKAEIAVPALERVAELDQGVTERNQAVAMAARRALNRIARDKTGR